MQNNNKHTGFKGWMRDKGYYIVLVLCIAAVGISGYLYFNQSAAPDAHRRPANAERPGAGGDGQRRRVFATGCRAA